jgi:hypothetical protein
MSNRASRNTLLAVKRARDFRSPAQRYFKMWDVCSGGLAPQKSG